MSKNRIFGDSATARPFDPVSLRENPFASKGIVIRPCEEQDDYTPYDQPEMIMQITNSGWIIQPLVGDVSQPLVEQQIADLASRVEYLEILAGESQQRASYFEVRDALNAALQITKSVFSVDPTIREQQDCETPSERYFILEVSSSLDIDTILQKQDQWHEQLAGLPANVRGLFRLTVDPQ